MQQTIRHQTRYHYWIIVCLIIPAIPEIFSDHDGGIYFDVTSYMIECGILLLILFTTWLYTNHLGKIIIKQDALLIYGAEVKTHHLDLDNSGLKGSTLLLRTDHSGNSFEINLGNFSDHDVELLLSHLGLNNLYQDYSKQNSSID